MIDHDERKKFNKEVGDFVTTVLVLGFINFMTSPGRWWFLWVVGFWGAALVGKYIKYSLNDGLEDDHDGSYFCNRKEQTPKWKDKDLV